MTDSLLGPRIEAWCVHELSARPAELLLTAAHMSQVTGVRLDDGREVVVKSRPDPTRRAVACLAVQRAAADAGFPCARPLTDVAYVDGRAVHAEEWRPGGETLVDDGPDSAALFAHLLAELIALAARVPVSPPLPNPPWVRWDHGGPGVWPPDSDIDDLPGSDRLPPHLIETALRLRARLMKAFAAPCVLGHADWESQNVRWIGGRAHAVHDWDSIAWMPEAALVGFAAGAFASSGAPALAPLASSETFIAAYEDARGRRLADGEREVAWAASLWLAVHNARAEILHQWPKTSWDQVLAQGDERLERARA